jgi:hypothetical protein
MLTRCKLRAEALNHTKAEDMLRIMRNAGRITMTPFGIDFVTALNGPILEPFWRGDKSGFLGDLAGAGAP